jgi:hypothetical protein
VVVVVTANLWKSYSFTIQVSEAGVTPVQMLTYDPTLSRVRIDLGQCATVGGTAPPAGSTWLVERSTDLVRWSTVRGGNNIPIPES